jgi:hypothetical protein
VAGCLSLGQGGAQFLGDLRAGLLVLGA